MPPIRELLLLHHTHTDIGYTHPQPVFWELSRRFIDEAIKLCAATSDRDEPSRVRWTCEVTWPLLHWLEAAPAEQVERFAALARSGQMDIGAMPFNITPLMDATELARTLEPLRELRARFGLPLRVAINHDVNGLPWTLVPLLLDAGVDCVLMGINVHSGGFPLTRPLAFRWEGPDGRWITVFNGEHYNTFARVTGLREARQRPSLDAMAAGLQTYLQRIGRAGWSADFAYLTLTHTAFDDNNPPDPLAAELIHEWNATDRLPVIRYATAEMVRQAVLRQPVEAMSRHRGDWPDFWNFGAGSSALEVAVNRQARRRLRAAEALAARLPASPAAVAFADEAFRNVALFHEHTWGAFCSVGSAEPLPSGEQWTPKANHAWRARSLSTLLRRDQLERWAGNPRQAQGLQGLLLLNAEPVARRVCLRVAEPLLDSAGWRHFSSSQHHLDVIEPLLGDTASVFGARRGRWVGPLELPPLSATQLPLAELPDASVPATVQATSGQLQTSGHEMRFDPATGKVLSLVDRALNRELVDLGSAWEFFQPVRESIAWSSARATQMNDPRETQFENDWERIHLGERCWVPDWPARREGPARLLKCESVTTPEGATLVRRYEMPGCVALEQRITLLEHEPAVRCEVCFNLLDAQAPESLYFAFPLAVPGWRAHYDAQGLPAELDTEQLPGGCRDWVTAGEWLALHNPEGCVTCACPDAPLFQVGGFHFGRNQSALADRRSALLLAWATNNYWTTNFRAAQPGWVRLRWFLSASRRHDAGVSEIRACQAAGEVVVHPIIHLGQRRSDQLARVEGGCWLRELRRVGVGQWIATLANPTDGSQSSRLSLPGEMLASAHRCNALQERLAVLSIRNHEVTLEIPPRSLVAVLLTGTTVTGATCHSAGK
jgi:alpha-mannosidase